VDHPQLLHIVLDAVDARGLAEFYRELLGLHYRPGDEAPTGGSPDDADWLVLTDADGVRRLAVQQVAEQAPSTWPSAEVPMQLHLDLVVEDAAAVARHHDRAVALGARELLDRTDDPDEPLWVLADPAGHPFCVFPGRVGPDSAAPSTAGGSSRPRAAVVVTGTEVLTGRVADANGPWLADRLRDVGADIGAVLVVGDRPEDLRRALGFLAADHDLVITSGGLGPTADDLTAEVVADFQGRSPALDEALERRIAAIVEELSRHRGWRRDPEATAAATRKQALVPAGAHVLEPVGTAPGLVVPPAEGRSGPPVLVLPGPPPELQAMWDDALADALVQRAIGGAGALRQDTLRLYGTPESELAASLRRHEDDLAGLEITTCLTKDGEVEIVTRRSAADDEQSAAYDALVAAMRTDFADTLFSDDGRTIDRLVADALLGAGATIALAESCTAGMLAARLADLPGSSAYLLGGFVTYADQVKHDQLGVPTELLETVGAVSAEVARAMADGARARLGTTLGVGVTGVAGPGGGTATKPVGLVHVCVSGADGALSAELRLGGDRSRVRHRTTVDALHLVRRFCAGHRDGG